MTGRNCKVSIVIATAERPGIVLDCLRCLKEQVPPEVEVVIVDAGRDAPVGESAAKEVWPNTLLIRSDVMNAGLQRNEGVRRAANDLIIFLDDDCFIQPGWWPNIINPLLDDGRQTADSRQQTTDDRQPRGREARTTKGEHGTARRSLTNNNYTNNSLPSYPIGAVAGGVWCNPDPKFTKKRGGYINWRGEPVQITHRAEGVQQFCDWPMTTNMAVRKSVMEEIGGVPSAYGVYDEDVDLGLKIRRAGWSIAFVPQAAVYHYYRERPPKPKTKRSQFMLGRNRSTLLVRHYGLSPRLLAYFVVTPWIRLWQATTQALRACLQAYGHWLAYLLGMVAGVRRAQTHPVDRDKMEGDDGDKSV